MCIVCMFVPRTSCVGLQSVQKGHKQHTTATRSISSQPKQNQNTHIHRASVKVKETHNVAYYHSSLAKQTKAITFPPWHHASLGAVLYTFIASLLCSLQSVLIRSV